RRVPLDQPGAGDHPVEHHRQAAERRAAARPKGPGHAAALRNPRCDPGALHRGSPLGGRDRGAGLRREHGALGAAAGGSERVEAPAGGPRPAGDVEGLRHGAADADRAALRALIPDFPESALHLPPGGCYRRGNMSPDEARRILGLEPDDDPTKHFAEFAEARERIAEMVRKAPNDVIALRFQDGLVEFDKALAVIREDLEARAE